MTDHRDTPGAPARHVNHVGHVVRDLGAARRFYVDALGFVPVHEVSIPDEFTAPLLRIQPPVGATACYLQLGSFVLELLHFDRPAEPGREASAASGRRMSDPGLTHLSFGVDDIEATCRRVVELGGEVLDDTRVAGMAVMVRDPDGQLLELLPASYHPARPPG